MEYVRFERRPATSITSQDKYELTFIDSKFDLVKRRKK